jgi:hypothetical protein
MYGPSMSFKSFVALAMASAAAAGREWMGRAVAPCAVVYIGAEGGDALHIRRAAAQPDGEGLLFLIQERPQLDTPEGADALRSILAALGCLPGASVEENENYFDEEIRGLTADCIDVLCIIDTYSQTACGDEKGQVSAYIKNLRDMIDEAGTDAVSLSFLILDHATKAGGSYLGSVAKLNDVDSQLEVIRDGGKLLVSLHQRKTKDGPGGAPVFLEMEEHAFEGYTDGYGKPLKTLRAVDGSKARALADLATGKAGLLLELLTEHGDDAPEEMLRRAFYDHPSHGEGSKPDSIAKSYKRAKDRLLVDNLIEEVDGQVSRT